MIARRFWVSLLSTTLLATGLTAVPVQRAQANEAAAFLGGALLGGIIVNEVQKNKQRQQTTRRSSSGSSSGVSSSQRAENRQVQTALNYFGYNVGTVDGSLGRQSRAGISSYQAQMGYPIDGYLKAHERDFLLNSHQRALASANVAPYNVVLATQGPGGLLRTYRNEQLGVPSQPLQQATVPGQGQMAMVPAAAPVPAQPGMAMMAAQPAPAALPSFAFAPTLASPAEVCNEVNVRTAARGGVMRADQITDSSQALNEQFCLARGQAMADTVQLEAALPTMTPVQLQTQCAGLTQALKIHTQDLGTTDPALLRDETADFLYDSGQPLDQLASGGRLCLGLGYRSEDAEMALASALLLVATGQTGYAEVVGHHLREGFGIARATPSQAAGWMSMVLGAESSGQAPVLGQTPDRIAVLRQATLASPGGVILPVFPAVAKN